ncbi:hypothetical protein Glove_319g197 [Diversispora epigaea]|uniref:Uncharacterized protein n=1 Tax=Diversispora epigaea TaxID=1348612 RepID=A0A397HQ92_9GLOM|nr:hypothetical protein Glove_319g197 [Diversispora epigaea]
MNFRMWELEEAKDKYAVDCHGHLHLHLKLDLVRKMENQYKAMRGKINAPIYYSLLDCQQLETSQLMSIEMSSVKSNITKIKSKILEIKSEISEMLEIKSEMLEVKTEISEVKSEISEVKSEIKNINNSLNTIIKYLKIHNES